ncbi:hypothetical protein [Eggerthia catenaformis]|uniref:hypothetical protein n=1 Tax=Eggerthia catenaformis TaxID=31973 RepID=UPI0028E190EA|nr:hypothetical protein [Eggerthia catenaformis]
MDTVGCIIFILAGLLCLFVAVKIIFVMQEINLKKKQTMFNLNNQIDQINGLVEQFRQTLTKSESAIKALHKTSEKILSFFNKYNN